MYWAEFFNAGWPDDIGVEVLPIPPPEWVFAPTAAPSAAPTFASDGGSTSKRKTQGLVAALVVCAVLTVLICCFLWFRPKARKKSKGLTEKTYPDHRRAFPPPTTCLEAFPSSTLPTRLAKLSVQNVSSTLY